MRILQVIESLTRGGAERLAVELAREFAGAGHHSRLVCLSSPGPWAEGIEREGLYAGCLGKRPGADISCVGKLRRFIREFEPDIVNSHLFTANLWTRLAGLGRRPWRLVVTLHNVDSWRRDVHRALDHVLIRAADRYVAVGPAVAAYWRRHGVRGARLAVIPNAVGWNGTPYVRPFLRKRPVLRACGRLVPQKGFDVLVEAAGLVASRGVEFTVEIIGEGPERARLVRAVRRLGLDGAVGLPGARDDARELIASADVFLMPSLREGLPLVLLEALHAGRPVLASRLGALAGVVTAGSEALLVEPGSPGALARGIERLLSNPDEAVAMGLAGRQRARREFTMERAAGSYLALYSRLLAGGAP